MAKKFEKKDKEFKEGKKQGGNLPQYGKKGHTPRDNYKHKYTNLDKLSWNDITDWNAVEGYSNVTKFNWDLIVGRPRDPRKFTSATYYGSGDTRQGFLPTQLMRIDLVTGPGWAENVNDGVNRALAQVMANIRANLSTSNIGFETADLGIFFASTASIAAMIGYAKRTLEVINEWDSMNFVFPQQILQSLGFSYSDIRDNINSYTMRLNAAIDMYNNMSIVDCWRAYDRQYSMFHSIFRDEDSSFGQLYLFAPANYYTYDDSESRAISYPITHASWTNGFSTLLETIEGMIDSWYTSSDLYQINGVLLRAFKNAPRQNIPHHEVSVRPTVSVDRSFLLQIMNCTINSNLRSDSLNITQDYETQNYVIWKPKADPNSRTPMFSYPNALLRIFEDHVAEDDNMEMTRLINFVDPLDFYYRSCGSEIVKQITMFTYDATENYLNNTVLTSNDVILDFEDVTYSYDWLFYALRICPFRYIPAIHILLKQSDGQVIYKGMLGDVYNYTLYPRQDWMELQNVAYRSLWKPRNLGFDTN